MIDDAALAAPAQPARRAILARVAGAMLAIAGGRAAAAAAPLHPQRQWYAAAAAMKSLAESWGDQPYGAVLVLRGEVAGNGPSRVVKNGNPDAHAEREAIRDAQRRLGAEDLAGAVLYSTSRPCGPCQAAAAAAGVSRMYFGPDLTDGGAPAPAKGAGR